MQKGFAPVVILVGLLVLASAVSGAYYFLKVKTPVQKACTMDAKICPGGDSVGRTGPNCEFSPCPSPSPSPSPKQTITNDETANWKMYENNTYKFSFQYPGSWVELTTEDDKTRGNPGYTNREITIETDKKEIVNAVVFDGKADKSNDKDWAANIDIGNNKSVLITYVQCMGPGCLEGQKDIKIFKQILSTFKFTQ